MWRGSCERRGPLGMGIGVGLGFEGGLYRKVRVTDLDDEDIVDPLSFFLSCEACSLSLSFSENGFLKISRIGFRGFENKG